MHYKITISDGTILEKCIEHVAFDVDTIDYPIMRNNQKKSMIITGKIDTDEGTAKLYQWAMISGANLECYKEIKVEALKNDQLVRSVCFSKAFVVDYSENYSNYEGVGTFTLHVRQLFGKDIECIGQTAQRGTEEQSPIEEIEEKIEAVKEKASVVGRASESKSVMSITDRLAKQKVDKPVIKNLGVSASGKKLEGTNLEINEKFRGDQFKVEDSFDASIDKAKHDILTAANCKTTCALNENLDGHLTTNDNIKLSDSDKKCLEELANYRKDISPITEDTIVQKVIGKDQLDAYLDKDKPKGVISGCVSKASDVAPFTNNADEAYKNLRLDYKGNNFKEQAENGGETYVMRCKSGYSPTNGDYPVINEYTNPPCTGTGFLGSESHLLPEYTYGRGQAINEGAIFTVDKNGNESMCAAWDDDLKRFIKIE